MKVNVLLASVVLLVGMLWVFDSSDAMNTYFFRAKLESAEAAREVLARISETEKRRQQIIVEAEKLRIEPINAKVDPVWKAIPGYNGLEVDIDKTLKLALENPMSTSIPYVFKEIVPDVKLADLPVNPIYKGNSHKPMVSFMINVAWGNEYIPEILKTLKDENVKTTFFLDGSWLQRNKAIAERMLEEGHELSNHAYSHKNMSRLSRSAAETEILKTEHLLNELGVKNRLFAPPSGDFNLETVRIAKQLGLYTVLWTHDTVDWKKPDPDSVVRKITSRMEPGALILMHPTEASSKALGPMIQYAKKHGYAVGTASDLISEKRVTSVERPVDF